MSPPDATRLRPLVDSTNDRGDADALRRQAEARGYLLLRGVIDLDALRAVRRVVHTHGAACGWLETDGKPIRARAGARLAGRGYDDPEWIELQRVTALDKGFTRLSEDPALIGAMSAIFDEPPRPRCGDTCRVALPGCLDQTTRPHQDLLFFGREMTLWAAWLPLVDCPVELGPLAVLGGSHRGGLLPCEDGPESGVAVPEDAQWAASPLRPGDALLFHGKTIHAALPNTTTDRVRLSADFRYQPGSEPLPG